MEALTSAVDAFPFGGGDALAADDPLGPFLLGDAFLPFFPGEPFFGVASAFAARACSIRLWRGFAMAVNEGRIDGVRGEGVKRDGRAKKREA
jgi:hypothetical protein